MNFKPYKSNAFNFRPVAGHAFCWLLLMIYELSVYSLTLRRLPSIPVYLLYYSCNIALFYCQVRILRFTLDRSNPRYLLLIVLIFAETAGFLGIKMVADLTTTDFSHTKNQIGQMIKAMATLDFLRNLYYAAFASLYWTMTNIHRYQRKADAAEIERLQAVSRNAELAVSLARVQNAYLQQQINPHLLLNTLTFIHGRVNLVSPEAADVMVLLSDLLRFTISETGPDGKITLAEEAAQIENLIRINRYRFNYPMDLEFVTGGDLSGRIIPLVLMTLAENVFKHGDLTGKPAAIHLTVAPNGTLRFFTRNYKRPRPIAKRLKSMGLANIRTRLNFAYGGAHLLQVKETGDLYESELTLQL